MTNESSGTEQTYTVTARKWRPKLFDAVVGQEHVTQTLRNALQSGRLHHAYIFNGPRGVGKTTTARILAKALNCPNRSDNGEPCNVCQSCTDIMSGRSLDVIEIDGASNNSVDDVRKLRDNAKYPPVVGDYKMYIIDEVHMLSTSAFNALLKTLEEPPKHLIFVFATTEPHKVPATILSRCQRFDFRRMQIDEIVEHLRYISQQESLVVSDEALYVIARKGDGSMRDSQSIFDQVISFCGSHVTYEKVTDALNIIDQEFFFGLAKTIREKKIAELFAVTREIFMRGYDLQECLIGLAEHYRNILTVISTGDATLIETAKAFHARFIQEAAHYTQHDVIMLMNIIISTEQALRFAPQPRLRFEFALVQMANLESAVSLSQLLSDVGALRKQIDQGKPIVISSGAPTTHIPTAHTPVFQNSASASVTSGTSSQAQKSPSSVAPNFAIQSSIASTPNTSQSALQSVSPQTASTSSVMMSLEKVRDSWWSFVAQYLQLSPILKTMFSEENFTIRVANDTLEFSSSNNVLVQLLSNEVETIQTAAAQYFKRPIRIVLPSLQVVNTQTFSLEQSPNSGQLSAQKSAVRSAPSVSGNFTETPQNFGNAVSARASSVSSENVPSLASAVSQHISSSVPQQEVEMSEDKLANLPPLDRHLVELFGAVEVVR